MSELAIAVSKHDHFQGDLNAPCGLVEYGDYECPSCGEIEPAIKRLQAHFGNELCFVFRNFPLQEIHPWARPAAEVAECAASQGKFWEMHDLLFANQERLSEDTLRILCERVGLTDSDIRRCQAKETATTKIEADFSGGVRSGVNGTPSLFLNGERYDGPRDYESLVALMEQVLLANGD